MLYVVHTQDELWNFMLSESRDRDDVKVYCVDTFYTYLRILKRILPISTTRFSSLFLRSQDIEILKKIKSEDRLLILGHASDKILSAISRIVPEETSKILYLWNPLLSMVKNQKEGKKLVGRYIKSGYDIFTFNQVDALNFGINLTNQIYKIFPQKDDRTEFDYDFYFLGYDKKRGIDIFELQNELLKKGFRVLIDVRKKGDPSLSYEDNVRRIVKSKVLIDLVQDGQNGMTLRPLEAIAYKRKLLTNNKAVLDEPFYNSNNIYHIDNVLFREDFDAFVRSNYQEIPRSSYSKYDINNWLTSFV